MIRIETDITTFSGGWIDLLDCELLAYRLELQTDGGLETPINHQEGGTEACRLIRRIMERPYPLRIPPV
jgi:hypothetical protein